MKIPQGYKQTELGIIPEDWNIRRICDGLANVKSGKRLPSGYYVTENRTSHPYIRVIDMYDGGVDVSNIMYVPEGAYPAIENYRIFKEDIFISVAGSLGIVGKIPKKLDGANLTENANRLTNIACDRDYLLYFLRSPYIQNIISSEQTIGAQPKLALTRIRKFEIILPDTKVEQQTIAKALSNVDALIAALDKKIAKKRLIKQGAMQQLLTGKKRLAGFPTPWQEKRIKDIAELYQSKTIAQDQFTTHGYNVYGANGIIGKYHQYNHKTDQVLITCRGSSCGTVNYSIGFCWITGNSMVINMDNQNEINKRFVYYLLYSQDLSDLITGTGQPQIIRQSLLEYIIRIPISLKEQQAIVTILSDMDKEIADLEARRDKYKLIKSGMMQKLLTGQIRLTKPQCSKH